MNWADILCNELPVWIPKWGTKCPMSQGLVTLLTGTQDNQVKWFII